MTWHYQRAGRAFDLETAKDADRYLIVWRYPSGRKHSESFRKAEVFSACLRLLTQHLETMGWQCVEPEPLPHPDRTLPRPATCEAGASRKTSPDGVSASP